MISEYDSHTPRTLMHALGDTKINDTASLLNAIILLCKMLETINGNLAHLNAKLTELTREQEAIQHAR